MKRKPSKTGYNRLLASDAPLISRDPLIGILELDTDSDPIELAMNRKVAERLMSTVVEFLQAAERADAPTFGGRAPGAGRRRSGGGTEKRRRRTSLGASRCCERRAARASPRGISRAAP
jgi:hypothetical protein